MTTNITKTTFVYSGPARKLCVTVAGGLGDQICAEPVLRHMHNTFFAKDDLVVMTQYPTLFRHLPYRCFDEDQKFSEPYSSANTHPKDFDHFNFHRMHPVDFISILLLRRQLPREDKTIKLQYTESSRARIAELGITSNSVIVHPGVSWDSKTFPIEFWQKVIDGLRPNHQVIVIGSHASVSKHRHHQTGHLPVNAAGCLDLREKLNLDELLALIDRVPVLVSNDSGPIHAAGAFDNHIGLIPSCKHPDYILPYRKGDQGYKTQVLWKSDASAYYDFDPLTFVDVPIGELRFDWQDILPDTQDVVDFVAKCLV